MKVHNLLVTGSLTSGGENITAISSSVSSTVTSLSSSVSTSIGGLSSSMASSMTSLSSSLTSSMGSLSSSMASSMTTLSSSLTGSMGSLSSSMVTSMNSLSSSMGSIMATTGSNLFKGDQTISGSIIPSVNNTYDLGSPTQQFRHVYISSGSLYVNGTKVLGSTAQELQITTDAGQSFKILEAGSDTITLQAADGNITLAASGGGDVILDPTSGVIALKGTTTLYAGNKILSSDGNAIQIGNGVTITGSLIVTGFIETQELRTTYISSSILYRSGSTKFGDELTDTHSFTGSLSVSGSISIPGSGLISGSSQITYSGLSGVPSGIISGSAQLPSGIVSSSAQTITNLPSGVVSGSSQVLAGTTIHSGAFFNGITVVSGSAQVDVLSTTNIARLATTGSNSFTGTQTFGYGRLVAVGHNSSAQITFNASYDGGQTNTYTPGYAGDSTAGMFVMKQSNGGYGDVNFYGKNHQTNGSSQDISTFNVIMGMNTNGRVAIGKLTANAPLDVNGNTLVTGSISSTANISAGTTFNWNGGIGALSYGTGVVTLETNTANAIQLKTNGTTAITISTGQTATFANSITAGTSISAGTFLGVTRAGANGVGEGPYMVIAQPSQSKQWLFQLNGSAGLDYWHYNGSAWSVPLTLTTSGASTFTAMDGSGARTTPFTAMTLVSDNSSNPYDGFGTALLFKNRIYSGGPTPGGIQDGARIRTSLKNNSTVNYGTDLLFDVTPTGNGSLTNVLSLSYDYGSRFSTNLGIGSFGGLTIANLLELRKSEATLYDQTIDNGQDGAGATLSIRNDDISVVGSFSQINMQVSGDSGRALGRIVTIRMGSATSDMAFVTENNNVKSEKLRITSTGNVLPGADASYNLGSTSLRWNNLYTTDLHLSNEGKQNIVDGTWGDWTLQEGENDIYMLNNRSGEKFKIKLEKIV